MNEAETEAEAEADDAVKKGEKKKIFISRL